MDGVYHSHDIDGELAGCCLACTSTIVVMGRETGSFRWPALAFGYMLTLAYGASFVTYQAASAVF